MTFGTQKEFLDSLGLGHLQNDVTCSREYILARAFESEGILAEKSGDTKRAKALYRQSLCIFSDDLHLIGECLRVSMRLKSKYLEELYTYQLKYHLGIIEREKNL